MVPPTEVATRVLRGEEADLDRLLERARRGVDGTWDEIVDRFQRLVYSVPYRYRLNDDDADDVFVITFEALLCHLDRIESGRALPRWLATTATRECLRLLRLRGRVTSDQPLDDLVATEDAEAEAEAIRADDALQVRTALTRMDPRCRDLLGALYADEETPYAEIAVRLGMPLGAVGPTRSRCLEKLRRTMETAGFFG